MVPASELQSLSYLSKKPGKNRKRQKPEVKFLSFLILVTQKFSSEQHREQTEHTTEDGVW